MASGSLTGRNVTGLPKEQRGIQLFRIMVMNRCIMAWVEFKYNITIISIKITVPTSKEI